ncbi:MAG: hypothetical protein ACREQ5_14025, partial [Candidatus Dormibacteria bacterium]
MRYVSTAAQVYGPNAAPSSMPQGPQTPSGGGAQVQGVPVTHLATQLRGSIVAQPLTWLFGLVLFLVAWKLIEEKRGGEEAFEKIRVDGTNVVKVGAMAMLFFIVAKYLTRAYIVPGLSALVQSA